MKNFNKNRLRFKAAAAVLCALVAPSVFALPAGTSAKNTLKDPAQGDRKHSSFAAPDYVAEPTLQNDIYESVNVPVKFDAGEQRLTDVTKFALAVTKAMIDNDTAYRYTQNTHFTASSTFPAWLFRTLDKNPWMPAPFMPVPDEDLSCYYGIPPYRSPQKFDPQTEPIEVAADRIVGNVKNKVEYSGNVTVNQGDLSVKSDVLRYDQESGIADVSGNITVQSSEVTVSSPANIVRNMNTGITEVYSPSFQLNGSVASGKAEKITLFSDPAGTEVEGLEFTTCPAGDRAWHIRSEKMEMYDEEALGEAYDTVLYVKDVPVFWMPYVTFPISDKSKSGLLYPSASVSSVNGFDYAQPIYWSIESNYDYTVTPRIMTKRGLLIGNEFRYMPVAGSEGSFTFDYLPDDNSWELKDRYNRNSRFMLSWQHHSSFLNGDLIADIDYKRIRSGDYDYINDIGIPDADVTDNHLKQSFTLNYDRPLYNIGLEVRDYQNMLPFSYSNLSPFSILPQIYGEYTDAYEQYLINVKGEISKFSAQSDSGFASFDAVRTHIEPSVSRSIINTRGTTVTAGVRGFFTHYSQDGIENLPEGYITNSGFSTLTDEKTRSLFLLQLDAKTVLERRISDLRHTQTIEPQISYQYIPYRNQDDIMLFDSTDRMIDYHSQFSYRTFTGYDRIADLNRVTLGLTSRILDPHDRELMRFGVSQSYSFVQTRVTLTPNDPSYNYPKSPVSFFFDTAPMRGISAHGAATYNNEINKFSSWNAMTEYRNEDGFMVQINYRFAEDGNRDLNNRAVDISQAGLLTSIPLSRNMRASFALYQDLEQSYNIDSKAALRWEECCWSVALVYERYNKTNWNSLTADTDHLIGIEFELKGLGAVNITGNSGDNDNDTYLLKYFNPTGLNR